MCGDDYARYGELRMIMHHIYEFKKGVRNLILCTMCKKCAELVMQRLENQKIAYICRSVSEDKVNLFFGKKVCLNAVSAFVDKPLNRLTPEEDFMLGTMLGYDIGMQCERFCHRKKQLELVG